MTRSSNRNNTCNMASREQYRRGMWITDRVFSRDDIAKGKEFKEGFYIFGGNNK